MSYELFSDRARKILQLANSECLEFNHEYVGTEHILLALCKEGSGCAAVILRSVNIDYCTVRKEANKLVQKGPDTLFQTGKRPLTPRAKNVITYAQEESKNMGLKYVGTEHILLGLLREEEGVACQILKNLNLGIADARQHVYNLLGFAKEEDWIPVRPQPPNISRLPSVVDDPCGRSKCGAPTISEIDINTKEGRLLLAAIAKLTTESQTDKTPDEVMAQCEALSVAMFQDTQASHL